MAREKPLEQKYRFRKVQGVLHFESRYYALKFLEEEYIPKCKNQFDFEIKKVDQEFIIYKVVHVPV